MAVCVSLVGKQMRQQLAVGNDIWSLLVEKELEKGHRLIQEKSTRP